MAFSGNFMCTSFKKELLEAVHNFKNFKNLAEIPFKGSPCIPIAPVLLPATTAYTTSNEISGTGTRQVEGGTLTRVDPTTSSTTCINRPLFRSNV